MSGHSKWATIKRKKGKLDQERGKVFTQHIKEITVAAREGGGDPVNNARLRTAVAAAKGVNMPADNIKRAILKGTGQLPGVTYESATYEGYGPAGTAVLLEVMTDNKNRIVAEIRHIFTKYGGNMGANGCVGWMFHKKGVLTIELTAADENTVMEIAMENGAEDINGESGAWEITSQPNDLETIKSAFEAKKIPIAAAEITMVPENSVKITSESEANSMMKMYELLEELDDVQKVYSNFDIAPEILEKLA
ncbi:MAG: YebC/PmpR family DNA-binding transcriptional regulator [Candidatus Zixiibacteriota bacterium]